MADDPYAVLGISKTASDDEIKKAHRRLAKQLHPDLKPGDVASAERFKRVNAAYEFLSDPERRKRYDRGEIDASGEPVRPFYRQAAGGAGAAGGWGRPGPADDMGFGDVFADIFGGGRGGRAGGAGFAVRGQDVRYTLDVDFLEAVLGARKRVTLPDGGQLDIAVPEGVTDGQVLRLRGKGQQGFRGGEAGDALVEIRVRPHPQMKRVGDDIVVEVPISIDEAVLGAKIEVATTSGRVQLTVPKGTSSGKVLRLKGKGVRNSTTGVTGDQLVTLKIVLPDTIDESLAYFMSEWRQRYPYDPRRRG